MLLLFGVKRGAGPAGSRYRILASDWPTLLIHSSDSLLPSPLPLRPSFQNNQRLDIVLEWCQAHVTLLLSCLGIQVKLWSSYWTD
jgi:hypothetical protein